MEQSFADLLRDAFSEAAGPSFPDVDLDFENLKFDETFEDDISQENLLTMEDRALQQETSGQTVLSSMETEDMYKFENVDEEQCDDKIEEEDFEGVGVMSRDKTLKEDYTTSSGESEEEGSVSGEEVEDEEDDVGTGEKPGDLLRSVRCSDEFCDGNEEDRIFAEEQPLAPECAENPQVRNEEQGESESDEEMSYFERVPKHIGEMMTRGNRIEEDEQEREEEKEEALCHSECEGKKIEQEQHVLTLGFEQEPETPCRDGPVRAILEFPEISVQNLQDLIAEVDSEEFGEKVKDFSGEEHQDAGESFADYPSDFSSCEYVEDGRENQECNRQSNALAVASDSGFSLEKAVADITWMGRAEDNGEGDEYLYSRDSEIDNDEFRNLDVSTREKAIVENVSCDVSATRVDDGGETGDSDSYTSSGDDVHEKSSDDEELFDGMRLQDLESNKQLEETCSGSSTEFSDYYNRANPADFNMNWNLDVLTTDTLLSDLLTTEDSDETEKPLLHVTQLPAEDVNSYSAVQRGDAKSTSPSNQGSLDDIFFFNNEPEASGITELAQLQDDEYEEERNWEQEQERINAFYEFYYDNDGENERQGRQIKVQFCADPLSQVIHYETDSSDRDSVSSSTEGEEDPSYTETYEELRKPDYTTQITPSYDPLITQPPPENVPDLSNTHIHSRKHKCFNMLKLTLKMGLVVLMGLMMFWFVTDQAGWFSHVSFF